MNVKAILFDAYWTLFDVHSVVEKCEHFFPERGKKKGAFFFRFMLFSNFIKFFQPAFLFLTVK